MRLNIQDIMRANYVHRWQLVNVSRVQTVAEHSFNVAMLSKALMQKMDYDPQVIDSVMHHALLHDLDEVIIGDIPTPTKQRVRELGVEINEILEVSFTPDHFKTVIKVADYLDSMWFVSENGVGRHACLVRLDIENNFRDYISNCPDELRIAANAVRQELNNGDLII